MVRGEENGGAAVVFDWYAASFPGVDEDEFIGEFLASHGQASVAPYVGKTHGYERGYRVVLGDQVLASVLAGGNGEAPLNAWASGSKSRDFAEWARGRFPGHYLTRGDAAIDLNRPGAWGELQDLFFDLKEEFPRVQTSVVGDLFGGRKGVTYYMGSVKSESRMRFYQKGLQQPEAGQPHHVRAEYSVKPKGMLRYGFASAPAASLWSYAPLSRVAFERLKGFDPGQAVRETARRTELERRVAACSRQYGRTIAELRALLGADSAVIEALLAGSFSAADQQGQGGD
jgi:hypothetical protein